MEEEKWMQVRINQRPSKGEDLSDLDKLDELRFKNHSVSRVKMFSILVRGEYEKIKG